MVEALLAPFAALRPTAATAPQVIARPYDVLSFEEARAGAAGRPLSFLHVSRAEIDLPPGTDAHAPEVYAQAGRAFRHLQEKGALVRDSQPCFYAYRMIADGHVQTGVAAAGSIAAYRVNRIRRHEHTRPDKELDRARQIAAVGAHTGPVLLAHPPDPAIAACLAKACRGEPLADAPTDDGTRHQIWRIAEPAATAAIIAAFEAMPAIYIADGHHRSAAAARVAGTHGGNGRFLVVSFPSDQMRILDYNRIVRDLNGHSADDLLRALERDFTAASEPRPVRPARPGEFGMYLAGRWYRLAPHPAPDEPLAPVDRLDVSRLSRRILEPLFGIDDPRTDPRIDFVGGGRGLDELARRVDSGGFAVAFALYPTALADLMAVADAGLVMPPKSTWFEPKLADGLLSLPLD
jgi:uncharacterized protein (DUF1015 family)